jgi:hypothetical protein
LKTGIVEPEKMSVARQHFSKHIPVAMNIHTMEKLLEAVFSMQSVPKLYGEEQQDLY